MMNQTYLIHYGLTMQQNINFLVVFPGNVDVLVYMFWGLSISHTVAYSSIGKSTHYLATFPGNVIKQIGVRKHHYSSIVSWDCWNQMLKNKFIGGPKTKFIGLRAFNQALIPPMGLGRDPGPPMGRAWARAPPYSPIPPGVRARFSLRGIHT